MITTPPSNLKMQAYTQHTDKPQVEKTPHISEQIDRLQNSVVNQTDNLRQLRSKMEPVMSISESNPPPTNVLNEPEPTCPLASVLYKLREQIAQNNEIICTLINRLEV